MPNTQSPALDVICQQVAQRAKRASVLLADCSTEQKNAWLVASATRLRDSISTVLAANEQDLAAAPGYGLDEAQTDRLRLSPERIEGIAQGMESVAALPDPIGEVMESSTRPNGLQVSRVRVPLGVVFFIYESRPNVTADAAAICAKSGNAVILRGGKEAAHSSAAIVEILRQQAGEHGLPADAVQLVEVADREAVGHFLALDEFIDLAIPRGGEGLIRRVAAEARMPVIKHYHGNCHVYVDAQADLEMARQVVVNSKCQRMGVCNACESLVVHAEVAAEFLPAVGKALGDEGVELRGDQPTCELWPAATMATEEDFGQEYLAPTISVKIVGSIEEAIEHINQYGSGHTDSIVSTDQAAVDQFARQIDSATVMVNASTRFNDGGELGLGAEIGISTDKFHARGPCGLRELTSYKWVVRGSGQLRT